MTITTDSRPRLGVEGEVNCSPLDSGGGVDRVFSAGVVQRTGRRVLELLAEAERLTAEAVGGLGLIDEAGLAQLWGYRSTERLVTHGASLAGRQGHDLVVLARHLNRHAATAAAVADRDITVAQAVELARAARGLDAAYAESEAMLLAGCPGRDVDQLRRLLALWRARQDDDAAAEDAEHRWNQRGVHVQPSFDGSCSGSFRLDPVGAETFLSALETRPDPVHSTSEPRSLTQRRADKLVDVCHQSLHGVPAVEPDPDQESDANGTDQPPPQPGGPPPGEATTSSSPAEATDIAATDVVSAEPGAADVDSSSEAAAGRGARTEPPSTRRFDPRDWPGTNAWRQSNAHTSPTACNVVIDIETLAGESPEDLDRLRSELARGAPITGPALDRLLCDASFRALITDGPRTILAYNRATPAIPAGLRRAVHLRDRHCRFPGCDTPGHWCDIHHLIPRHRGGSTNHDNLTLVCRFHHGLVHDGGWSLARAPNGDLVASTP